MSITYDDLDQLVRVLELDKYESVKFESNGLSIAVDRASDPAGRVVPMAPPEPEEAPESTGHGAQFARVDAPAVGRIRWNTDAGPVLGAQVEPDTVLAFIDTLDECTPVVAGTAGIVSMVREFDESQFVGYGQWLLTVGKR